MKSCISIFCLLLISLFLPATGMGKTLVVEGKLDGTVAIRKTVTFAVEKPLEWFSYQFSVPATYDVAGNVQRLNGFKIVFSPQPSEDKETTDDYGNRYRKVVWRKLTSDIQMTISYTTEITANLSPRTSSTPFPLPPLPERERVFLQKSKLAQSDALQVVQLATELTAGAVTEHQAVSAILSHVADAIVYQYSPKQYDALYGLATGTGNCQNFAHLAVALLRASGIPARVVIGQTLKDNWKIPIDKLGSSLVQGMGEGLHAWVEVYYPDLGWLPCDPQQSRFFTSTRHIKFGHGLDAKDVSEFWQGSPDLPRMSESLTSNYETDIVDLRLRETLPLPSRYLVTGPVAASQPIPVPPPAITLPPPPAITLPPTPKPVTASKTPPPAITLPPPPAITLPQPPKPVTASKKTPVPVEPPIEPKPKPKLKPKPKPGTELEIGNRDFPALVEVYQVEGNIGRQNFDRETAEYATSKYLFAQAFSLDTPLALKDVALAMRKFGGDGMIYVDLVRDDGGKPSLEGIRSLPVALEKITRRPGYYWVDFMLPEGTKLAPGKHWLVLRHSGEAIMNWFYTPGKRVNGPDDTRSTARGWQWEDVLAGEFVYRVRGVVE